MKYSFILLIAFLLNACSTKTRSINHSFENIPSQNSNPQTVKKNFDERTQYNVTVNDTFYFRRKIDSSFVDLVFINKNRNNEFYKELQKPVQINTAEVYEYYKSPLKKVNTSALPDNWIELIYIKGEFYVNRPSNDWYNVNQFQINDSFFITCFSDAYIRPISSLKKLNSHKFLLTFRNLNFENKKEIELSETIYIVDEKRKIYLFVNSETDYYFATPTQYVSNFDLLDVYNNDSKTMSFVKGDSLNLKAFLTKNRLN